MNYFQLIYIVGGSFHIRFRTEILLFYHSLEQNNRHVFFILKKNVSQDRIFWNFEFGKNGQFSITDHSKSIRRRKKMHDIKRLLIV